MSYSNNSKSSGLVSASFGVEVITLAGSAGVGADQDCREVIIWPETNKSIKIGETALAASTGPILASDGIVLAIDNTNKLYFGGTTGDKVYILWRS